MPLFSKDFGVVYFWNRTAGLVRVCLVVTFSSIETPTITLVDVYVELVVFTRIAGTS